jgi:hypothetical protein
VRRVWIVTVDDAGEGLGFVVDAVFASEDAAIGYVEQRFGANPILDEDGCWNGSATLGHPQEVAIQRFDVQP